jgi:hypothetical protein
LILENCVLSIYDADLYQQCAHLASLLGATVTDQIVPSFTTHIVASQYTQGLKQDMLLLQGKTIENHNKQIKQSELASAKIIGHSHNMKVVTKEWLEECLSQGAHIGEEKYMPEMH